MQQTKGCFAAEQAVDKCFSSTDLVKNRQNNDVAGTMQSQKPTKFGFALTQTNQGLCISFYSQAGILWIKWENPQKPCGMGIIPVDKHVESVDFPGFGRGFYSGWLAGLCRKLWRWILKFYKFRQFLLAWKHFFCYTENMDNWEMCAKLRMQEFSNV